MAALVKEELESHGLGTEAVEVEALPRLDPVEAIRALTGGFGADVTIDAVGLPLTYEQAFYARDHAGTTGATPHPTLELLTTTALAAYTVELLATQLADA